MASHTANEQTNEQTNRQTNRQTNKQKAAKNHHEEGASHCESRASTATTTDRKLVSIF